jgi:hypothetical protein
LAAATPAARNEFTADLGAALHIADTALARKTRDARARIFTDWTIFCTQHNTHPSLRDVANAETKLSYLLVYALRRRNAASHRSSLPVRAGTVEDALMAVGQGITALGEPDPRKEVPGAQRNHPLLASFLKALRDADCPATRAYPINLTILRELTRLTNLNDPASLAVRDLCIIGFFWLLRPAEYLFSTGRGRSEAFRLCDVSFTADNRVFLASTAPLNDLTVSRITRATLTFNDQKNAVRGEQISHTITSDPILCPCKALARICQRLHLLGAPGSTPIHAYGTPGGPTLFIRPPHITRALRHAASALHHLTGIDPALLSARSLRPGGATALLCAGADSDIIQLLGRWKSDAMLRYLRVAAHAHSSPLAQAMLAAGSFTFAPTAFAAHWHPLPHQTPPAVLAALRRDHLAP